MNSLSIVIIGRNEEAHIARCLRSVIDAAAEIGGAEIVLVDSASTDRTAEIARSLGVRVLALNPASGMSAAAGRFVGFHGTRGELVMFVDGDTVIDRNWFRTAIPYFKQADVAGVMGYLRDFDEQGQELPFVGQRYTEVCSLPWLRGIAMYRRAAMDDVGTFNPYLLTEEEAELALRLRRRGYRLLQVPHEMGDHLRGMTAVAFFWRSVHNHRLVPLGRTLRYACREGLGAQLLFQRFRPTLNFIGVILTLLAGSVLFLFGHPFMAEITLGLLVATCAAIMIKKRTLGGPLLYYALHSLILYGLLTGFFTTQVKDPRDYPLEAIEANPANYRPVECRV